MIYLIPTDSYATLLSSTLITGVFGFMEVGGKWEVGNESSWKGCLDSRNWVEVRKWEVPFPISAVHPNTGKGK